MKPLYLLFLILLPALFSYGYIVGRNAEASNHRTYIAQLNLGGK